jgi:hypothetical protein
MNNMVNKKVKVGKKAPLVKNLLFVEGISRSGKFLLANILHGFKGIEHVQYYGLLEHIPFLERFGLIEKKAAQEIIQCEIDTHCYEMLIGRNLNYRKNDKSSIFNNPAHNNYLKRCKEPDGNEAIKKYYKERFYSMFIAHELMPNIKFYFDTFPKMKVISILRSPVYLVYSWYSRGLGKRYGRDSKLFSIPLQEKGENIPWFAVDWGEQYLKLSEMDRTIASIEWITHASERSYHQLNPQNRKKILYISYEGLLTRTFDILERVENFLKRSVLKKEIKIILEQERLPNLNYSESKQKKLSIIKKKSSPLYFKKLLDLEVEYLKREKTL